MVRAGGTGHAQGSQIAAPVVPRQSRGARRAVTAYSFRLYVNGQTDRSVAAEANLRELCEARVPGRYQLEIVDTRKRPELAEAQRVLATPTVVRLAPPPRRRVIGDLSEQCQASHALGLPAPRPGAAGEEA